MDKQQRAAFIRKRGVDQKCEIYGRATILRLWNT